MLWKDKYELGVALIDNQHKELFQRVDDFMQSLRSSTSWGNKINKVNETLEFMKNYVVEHFRDEEAYMQGIGYPDYAAHKELHTGMVEYVLKVESDYENSGFDEHLMQQFAGKLLAWLIHHVAASDQLVATYALEKGVRVGEN